MKRRPDNYRLLVLRELELRGWSRYDLAQAVAGKVPKSTVYEYLAGRHDLLGENLAIVLHAVGLHLKRDKET